jgi:hypothetical protein
MLDIPGLVTVVPYVEEQLRYKVFNPTLAQIPDLASTFDAVLCDRVTVPLQSELREERRSLVASGWARTAPHGGSTRPALEAQALGHLLHEQYWQLGAGSRDFLHLLFEDKFFTELRVTVPELSKDDVSRVVEEFHVLDAVLDRYGLVGPARRALAGFAATTWEGLLRGRPADTALMTIRHLVGALLDFLGDFLASAPPGFPPHVVARAAVHLALRRITSGP